MLKSCSKCGKIHDYNYKCTHGVQRDYTNYNNTDEAKLRHTHKWNVKSEQIKKDSNYLCAVCLDNGIYNYNNLETHHITKIKDDREQWLDDDNLICLCRLHHKQADKGLLTKEYLINLVKKRKMSAS